MQVYYVNLLFCPIMEAKVLLHTIMPLTLSPEGLIHFWRPQKYALNLYKNFDKNIIFLGLDFKFQINKKNAGITKHNNYRHLIYYQLCLGSSSVGI